MEVTVSTLFRAATTWLGSQGFLQAAEEVWGNFVSTSGFICIRGRVCGGGRGVATLAALFLISCISYLFGRPDLELTVLVFPPQEFLFAVFL